MLQRVLEIAALMSWNVLGLNLRASQKYVSSYDNTKLPGSI